MVGNSSQFAKPNVQRLTIIQSLCAQQTERNRERNEEAVTKYFFIVVLLAV